VQRHPALGLVGVRARARARPGPRATSRARARARARARLGLREDAAAAALGVEAVAAGKRRVEHRKRFVAGVEERVRSLPLVPAIAHLHDVPP
jgi:hypothetical protein